MKKYPVRELIEIEDSSPMKEQKLTLLKTVLLLLTGFGSILLFWDLHQGNGAACRETAVLLALLLGEFSVILILHNTTLAFSVSSILLLTVLLFDLLRGQQNSAVWLWLLAAPPLCVYIGGLFWGFFPVLYGQLILMILLWSPLRAGILTASTQYLIRLPGIYLIVALTCLTFSYSLTQYQIEQRKRDLEMGAELTEARERRKIDRMTGLFNRDYAEERIAAVLASEKTGAFFLMDLDNFKMINDLNGHLAGDQALTDFAAELRKIFGQSAILARLGGDEFIAYLPAYGTLEHLRAVAGSIIEASGRLADTPALSDKIGVSVGISLVPEDGTSFYVLYSKADKGQYFAKRNGKNRFCFYDRAYDLEEPICPGANLATLHRMVHEVQEKRGAFHVAYGGFSKIYQFLERNLSRAPKNTQVLLFSVNSLAGKDAEDPNVAAALPQLRKIIRCSLRTGDLMMDFSCSQIAVLLVNCEPADGRLVARRILDSCAECPLAPDISVTFEMGSIQSRVSPSRNQKAP